MLYEIYNFDAKSNTEILSYLDILYNLYILQ